MKIYNNRSTLEDFEAWAGAVDTKQVIIDNNKETDFEFLIEELYPEGIDETQLNDILWFESEWIYKNLDIREDDQFNNRNIIFGNNWFNFKLTECLKLE